MFEYHVHTASIQNLQRVIDDHARKGWRLHTCAHMPEYGEFGVVFERARNDSRGWKGDYHGPG